MNIYIIWGEESGGRARVEKCYMNPFDGLEDLEPVGSFVEEIPEPKTPEGCNPVLMVKLPAEGGNELPTLYYDYSKIPEPEETQVQQLTKEVETLRAADLANKSMINDLGEALLAILEG